MNREGLKNKMAERVPVVPLRWMMMFLLREFMNNGECTVNQPFEESYDIDERYVILVLHGTT